ncbi:MAG: phosphatase PAP2 family protein [Bacteroidales bacterium]|nr:phosphatase PAP2 family protein [Bacteroidales bacterium]
MIEALNQFDTRLFYLINSHHCTAMDWTMWVLSSRWCWLVVIALGYALSTLVREPRRWWLVLAGIGLCFLLADQGSVQLFKNTVCRLRPCHALPDVHLFREGCGGLYGFISSHAANAFAIATFFFLRYRRWPSLSRGKALAVPVGFVVWAVLTSYSRAYLGKHYPGDLLCGTLFGIVVGILIHLFIKWMEKKFIKCETKS